MPQARALTSARGQARPNSGIYLRRVSTESSFETLVLLIIDASPAAIPIPRGARRPRQMLRCCTRRDEDDLKKVAENIRQTERTLRAGGSISEDGRRSIWRWSAPRTTACWCACSILYRMTALQGAVFASREHGRASTPPPQLYDAIGGATSTWRRS
jgi:hypothetical protein